MLNRWRNGPTWRQWLILITVFVGMLIPWLWLALIFIVPMFEQSAKRTQDGASNSDGDSDIS